MAVSDYSRLFISGGTVGRYHTKPGRRAFRIMDALAYIALLAGFSVMLFWGA